MPHTKEIRAKREKTKKSSGKASPEDIVKDDRALAELPPPPVGKPIRMADFEEEDSATDDRGTESTLDGNEDADDLGSEEEGLDENDLNPFGDKWEV